MTKNAFLDELRRRLEELPQDQLESRIPFYEGVIEASMREGKKRRGSGRSSWERR